MHIAIDYTPALRQGAGIGRYTRGLVEGVTWTDPANRYTLFCAGESPRKRSWPENVQIRAVPIKARWLAIGWHRLHLPVPAESLVGKCDIFHSPDFTLPPLARARGVVTVHDLSFLTVPDCADPRLRAYLSAEVPRAVRRAHHVLADSENTRRDIVGLLGVPPERVSVVPAGVESHFAPVTDTARLAEVRERYRLPAQFILSVGTLEPRKNFPRLISAYARLRRRTDLAHDLVIVGGRGWLYDDVFAQVRLEDAETHVHFPGFVPDGDLAAIYTLAELFVFPSLYEGFGIPPLEAMACGTPVIVSDNSSLPETVHDAALQIDAYDTDGMALAMERVLTDPSLSTQLVDAGRAHARRFTWEAAARTLLRVYELVAQ